MAYAVPRMLRNGRRAMVMQVDVLCDADGEERLLASATVNFARHQRRDPETARPPRRPDLADYSSLDRGGNVITTS